MSTSNAVWGLMLQLQVADTVLVQRIEPSLFHRIADVAGGLVNIVMLIVVLALIPLLFVIMTLIRRLTKLLDRVQREIRPISQHAAAVADNVNYISTAVRADVQRVSDTVNLANQRVNEALALAEDRVREMHAVLDVVQDEAQETLIAAASTMRGVRVGAAALREHLSEEFLGDDDETDDDHLDAEGERLSRQAGPRIRPKGGRHGEA